MSYAKAAGKQKKKKELKPKEKDNTTQEQKNLSDLIKNLRISQPAAASGNKGKQWPQQQVRRPITGGLSKKLRELRIMEHEETAEEKTERLKIKLSKFECPFIWEPIYKKFAVQKETVLSGLQAKDDEIVDEKKFKWRNFILRLVISYELFLLNRVPEALDAVCELEKILIENTDNPEWLFLGIKSALWHVVTASKAFLYLEQNKLEKSEQMIDEIQPVNTMSRAGKAGIHGIRAAVFMEYGHEGNLKALDEAKEAVRIDNTSAEWHFLVGKCLGRIRRVAHCHDLVDELEMKSLDTAAKRDETNPLYKVYIAQVIREKAFRVFKQDYPKCKTEERNKLERCFKASYYRYKEALEMRPNCPHMLIRCAYGVMKLPYPYVDLTFVRESLDKAIELAPNNSMAHHIRGLYWERFGLETDNALEEIETAAALGNFGAAMDLVRMRYRLLIGDPIEDLEKVANFYADPNYLQEIYAQAGSYLLFIKRNMVEAIEFFSKVITINIDSYAMKFHKSLFLRMKDPVNMFEVILEELEKYTDWKSFPPEELKVLRRFRIKIQEHEDLKKKERLSVQKLVEMSKKLKYSDQEKERPRKKRYAERWRKKWCGMKRKFKKESGDKNKKKMCSENGNESSVVEKEECFKTSDKPIHLNESNSRNRASSISSKSSVDSDYERNSLVHGVRGFFSNPDTNDSNYRAERFSEHCRRLQSFCSEEASLCNISSNNGIRMKFSDFVHQTSENNSQHANNLKKTEESMTNIYMSLESLKLSDPEDSQSITSRRASVVTSIGSNISTGHLSVMDRVKQSYAMLNRGNNNKNQNETKSLQRSQSVQSVNKQRYKMKNTVQRSDSTQSLNIEVEVENLRRKIERIKPCLSGRSCNFMPSFSKNI